MEFYYRLIHNADYDLLEKEDNNDDIFAALSSAEYEDEVKTNETFDSWCEKNISFRLFRHFKCSLTRQCDKMTWSTKIHAFAWSELCSFRVFLLRSWNRWTWRRRRWCDPGTRTRQRRSSMKHNYSSGKAASLCPSIRLQICKWTRTGAPLKKDQTFSSFLKDIALLALLPVMPLQTSAMPQKCHSKRRIHSKG